MSHTLEEIAQQLKDTGKKVQLVYAFNGAGKTRLSRAFKDLVVPMFDDIKNIDDVENIDQIGVTRKKILYYNAFTEDLFYWDNDLENDAEPKLKIQPNTFTDWILGVQGQDRNIIDNFHHYTNDKLMPQFSVNNREVTFSLERGDESKSGNIKISKGEESNFIWSILYTLLEQLITILNVLEPSDRETDRFNQLEYVFIDDPVSSLDENHLIELAVSLADLIKRSYFSKSQGVKFIITTHSPLFYNVLYSELGTQEGYLLTQLEDGTFIFEEKKGNSNKSFSYHLYLKQILENAIALNQIEKYHFTLLRNLYEKSANFLGYSHWNDLLEGIQGNKEGYLKRIINFTSHRTLSNEEVAEPTPQEKQTIKILLDHLLQNYGYHLSKELTNG